MLALRCSILAFLAFANVAAAAAQTPEDQHRAVFRSMLSALGERDLERLDGLIAPDFVRHSQATPAVDVRSLDDFKAFLRGEFATVPDSEIECPMVVAEGDLLASWCTYRGTQENPWGPFPPTGKHFELDFAGVMRFQNGMIAEMWVTWDNLAALTQLGHFPPPEADAGG